MTAKEFSNVKNSNNFQIPEPLSPKVNESGDTNLFKVASFNLGHPVCLIVLEQSHGSETSITFLRFFWKCRFSKT